MLNQTTKLLLVLLVTLAPLFARSQMSARPVVCEVTIDIQNVTQEKDRVKVTITPPPMRGRSIEYTFPAVLPGVSGSIRMAGFIHEMTAIDDRGYRVRVRRKGAHTFRFQLRRGRTLRRIDYWVDDAFDVPQAGVATTNRLPQASATRFEAGKEFVLQPGLLVGTFAAQPLVAYRLTVIHPADCFGVSGLQVQTENRQRDKYFSTDYAELIDQPILYGNPDTLTTTFGQVQLRLAVFGRAPEGRTRLLRRILSPQLSALAQLTAADQPLSLLLMYSFDAAGADEQLRWSGQEHTGSGYYCLPEVSDENQLSEMLAQQADGALFRLLPLFAETGLFETVGGRKNESQAALNWWFGTGMSGYMNLLSAVQDSLMSEAAFMDRLRLYIRQAGQAPAIAFADRKALTHALEQPEQATALRARAIITVFLLDIELINSGNEHAGLCKVFRQLMRRPDELHRQTLPEFIASCTGQSVSLFFEQYVDQHAALPLIESLSKIGWAYAPSAIDSVLTFGKFTLQYQESNDAFYVRQAESGNQFGLRPGDRILSVNDVLVSFDNFDLAMQPVYEPEEGRRVSLRFVRGIQNDACTALPQLREELVDHFVRIDPAALHQAIATRRRLLHQDSN